MKPTLTKQTVTIFNHHCQKHAPLYSPLARLDVIRWRNTIVQDDKVYSAQVMGAPD